MMARYYIVPVVSIEGGQPGVLGPKYIDGVVSAWQAMEFPAEAAMLVRAEVTPEQHTAISAQPDATVVPEPLSEAVSAVALSVIQQRLESLRLPAEWVTTGLTYRQVLALIARIIVLRQRFHAQFGDLFAGGVTLDTTIAQLPAAVRQRLRDAAISIGLDVSGLTNQMTLRRALRLLAQQIAAVRIGTDDL